MTKHRPTKYIFITGGVMSALGKGIVAASLGTLLTLRGLKVGFLKLDPYINVDAGTMNPYQHGEVFVTEDGAETDMDLGHYERFAGVQTGQCNNVTAGRIYYQVIQKERRGGYSGGTIQVIPHITDAIKEAIQKCGQNVDLVLVEVGGTVGDIESLPFLEAIRQLRMEWRREDVLNLHLTWIPYIEAAGELKTKPTQHAIAALRQIGLQADLLVCRSDRPISQKIKEKIARTCSIPKEAVFSSPDVQSIDEVPLVLNAQGLDEKITEWLNIWCIEPDLKAWRTMVEAQKNPEHHIQIAMVGKYVQLAGSYESLNEALKHGGVANRTRVDIQYVDSEDLELMSETEIAQVFRGVHGILIPGGFGKRGIEGKIKAIKHARESQIPFLGICLGMQLAVCEIARHVCHLKGANSSEFDPQTEYPVIDLLRTPVDGEWGRGMRLGKYACKITPQTLAEHIYGQNQVFERHRHRYEFNQKFESVLEKGGLKISGRNPETELVEIIEWEKHPWFIGTQFHPEFRSRPMDPHPIFIHFIQACLEHQSHEQ